MPRYGSENFLGFYIEKYLMVLHKVQVILAQDSGRDLFLDAMILMITNGIGVIAKMVIGITKH